MISKYRTKPSPPIPSHGERVAEGGVREPSIEERQRDVTIICKTQ
jgi:hypothetical protein